MRTIFLTLILLSHHTGLISQNPIAALNTRPLNSVYFNLLGDAALISINYDRLFILDPSFAISGKLGIGVNKELDICIFGDCDPSITFISIPHHITCNYGQGGHFVEFGVGGAYFLEHPTQAYLLYPILGYRYVPLKSGKLNFRVYVHYSYKGNSSLLIPFGFSLGLGF